MKRCAFLTMASLDAFECYDHLLFEPLASRGWHTEEIPWRNEDVDWNRFDAVIIRSPWDYQDDPKRFISVLETIDQSTAHLENSLHIVRWNLNKQYLREMQQKGIPIVQTLWKEQLSKSEIMPFFDKLQSRELIIKPLISANADHTYRISRKVKAETVENLAQIFSDRRLMVQPFMENIISEGEFSLFYFAGKYSHAILKTPQKDDFRVQEEHGGRLKSITPEQPLRDLGRRTMQLLPETPLYARADYVRTSNQNFALMELELIEPSLYFNMDSNSPERFAEQFDRWMQPHLQHKAN